MLSDIVTILNDQSVDIWTVVIVVLAFWLVIGLWPLLRFSPRKDRQSEDSVRRFRLPVRGGRGG